MLDIQKLAVEMGVHCVTAHKLDATKSVRLKDQSIDKGPCSKEDTCLNIQNSGEESLKTNTLSTDVLQDMETQSHHGAKHKYLYLHMYEPMLCLNYSRVVLVFVQLKIQCP